MTRATGEVLPRFGEPAAVGTTEQGKARGLRALLAPRQHRQQLLALIITDKADFVSNRILTDLKRGVTAMAGKGMYTGIGPSDPDVRSHGDGDPQFKIGCGQGRPESSGDRFSRAGCFWRGICSAGRKLIFLSFTLP